MLCSNQTTLKQKSFSESSHRLVGKKRLLNPFPYDKFLDTSKLKEFADDNFKFDKNGGNFFKSGKK